jgi:hypothetical protein
MADPILDPVPGQPYVEPDKRARYVAPATVEDLSGRAARMLDMLPTYEQQDPAVLAYVAAVARELDRVEATLRFLAASVFPQNATDDFGILATFEQEYELPVAPANRSVDDRRRELLTAYASRRVAAGTDWERVLTRVVGSGAYTYTDNATPYGVAITTLLSNISQGALKRQMRAVTPAHLDLTYFNSERFRVDISQVDVDQL